MARYKLFAATVLQTEVDVQSYKLATDEICWQNLWQSMFYGENAAKSTKLRVSKKVTEESAIFLVIPEFPHNTG